VTGIEGTKLIYAGRYLDFKQGQSDGVTDPEQPQTDNGETTETTDPDETVYYCGSDEPNTNATSLDEAVSAECVPI
jgi:hypothetical protein